LTELRCLYVFLANARFGPGHKPLNVDLVSQNFIDFDFQLPPGTMRARSWSVQQVMWWTESGGLPLAPDLNERT